MLKYLSRFSFSLIALGAVLFYCLHQWQLGKMPLEPWQIPLLLVGGALCISLGALGIRSRHRR